MKKIYLFIGIVLIVIVGLGAVYLNGESTAWANPLVKCVAQPNEKPMKAYPFDPTLTDEQRKDSAGLVDFCARMQAKFSNSNLNTNEASGIYGVVYSAKVINDGSYGMPSPNAPPIKPLTSSDIKKRMSIKKISDGMYEIFYSQRGCGVSYKNERIKMQNNKIINQEKIEKWVAASAC